MESRGQKQERGARSIGREQGSSDLTGGERVEGVQGPPPTLPCGPGLLGTLLTLHLSLTPNPGPSFHAPSLDFWVHWKGRGQPPHPAPPLDGRVAISESSSPLPQASVSPPWSSSRSLPFHGSVSLPVHISTALAPA